jgi:hypothetical protein
MNKVEKLLNQLVQKLLDTYQRDLISVLLYGSAAGDDFDEKHSDLNVLVVLRELSVENLEKSEPHANWWRSLGNPAPLLLAAGEIERAADSFPIEFLDIREKHRMLHGSDPCGTITIEPALHRAQLEHEIRAKLMGLRQHYLGVYRDHAAVLKLMVDSLPSFATLLRHALILAADGPAGAPSNKRDVLEAAARKFSFDSGPFLALLDVREEKRKRSTLDVRATFQAYYSGIGKVCDAVDTLVKALPRE